MILKPQLEDLKQIGFYLGKITIGVGFAMFLPFIVGLVFFKEAKPAFDFLISAEFALLCGLFLTWVCRTERDLNWMQGMVAVALAWLVAMALSAVPLYLSGHYRSFLDACFEAMSGITTTGLTLVQDLDHLSYSHNLWRHLICFMGGQGITIVALALFVKGSSGGFKMYVGEGRDEKILPNIIGTARFIWLISIVYLIIGTLVLGFIGMRIGLKPQNAFFHGACIFMAGYDTAGFTPQSQSLLYYHNFLFEIVTMVIMILGAINFNLHYQLWKGNRREIWKNIETRTFLMSVMLTFFIVAAGLHKLGVYQNALIIFRKGFFQLMSGHTGTGYMTIYAQQFIKEWGDLALAGLILAMGLGGCACSTAGGIKMLRIGVILKAFKEDIKKLMLSDSTIVMQKFHHVRTIFLNDHQVRGVLLITCSYIVLYTAGALVGVWLGYPFLDSLFESTSAAANVGFSCGITDAGMPAILKITYMIQMWAGRLEFMSVFALIGFIVAAIKGKQ
ncbi:MAG: TrkH family potassium uptake protein [Candidatus Omnitrophica bacterium]|nr:TrkH family potassium uptake protein [Candidatus Omnitrophota bacterium]